ncbi:MAG: hypothetical protein HC769_27640 [Cyanobacteria bacterium CRU_2_1]|nr:hypothetical protein [Cyanobacteria bacterium CRU_2_1]
MNNIIRCDKFPLMSLLTLLGNQTRSQFFQSHMPCSVVHRKTVLVALVNSF